MLPFAPGPCVRSSPPSSSSAWSSGSRSGTRATSCGPTRRRPSPSPATSLDHRHLPAPDQDAHRAAGVLDAGGRHRAYGRHRSVGRIGAKALGWFVSASLVSLLLGLVLVNLLQPGEDLDLPLPDVGAATNLKAASLSLKDFVTHLVPKSAVEAMANNEILQIVVFSMFFGVALAALGDKGQTLADSIEQSPTSC